MGVQQENRTNDSDASYNKANSSRSCMAILWVQNGSKDFDKTTLIDDVKNMTGVIDATFAKEKPAILMIDYCTKEIKAVNLVDNIKSLGIYARIVGC